MAGISVGDIARRIKGPDEELTAVADRVRNWVKHGLLKPLGTRNPGTGRHRSFSERSIVESGVLNRLAGVYGSSAPVLALFKGALDKAVKELSKAEYVEGHLDAWLLTGTQEGVRVPTKQYEVLSEIRYVPGLRSQPVKADQVGPPQRIVEIPWLMADNILMINLTRMFSELGVPLKDVEKLKELAKRFPGRIERG
jgi:hypothetical protein